MGWHGLGAPHNPSEGETEPRATRIDVVSGVQAELWVGGWLSAVGPELEARELGSAWIVDCSGELPGELRSAAALVIPSVFDDVEAVPPRLGHLHSLAEELGSTLERGTPLDRYEVEAPERVYVLCKQGLNRSAFVAGLILRALSHPAGMWWRIFGGIARVRFRTRSSRSYWEPERPFVTWRLARARG